MKYLDIYVHTCHTAKEGPSGFIYIYKQNREIDRQSDSILLTVG